MYKIDFINAGNPQLALLAHFLKAMADTNKEATLRVFQQETIIATERSIRAVGPTGLVDILLYERADEPISATTQERMNLLRSIFNKIDRKLWEGMVFKDTNMDKQARKEEKAARAAEAEKKYKEEIEGLIFHEWPKISRLNRDIVITEKIDGTNGAIGIIEIKGSHAEHFHTCAAGDHIIKRDGTYYRIYAQSRTRILTPDNDNFGFAKWVLQWSGVLFDSLGPGLHFGEWWGNGIQRGYGLDHKRFSLFNVEKWSDDTDAASRLMNARTLGCMLDTVPVLYRGPWSRPNAFSLDGLGDFTPAIALQRLKETGSFAAPGYDNPEGICIFHKASGSIFKATIVGDEKHKGEL